MLLRRSKDHDVERIMEILSEARLSLALRGIDQWQGDYPQESTVRRDIEIGTSYVVEDSSGLLVATAMIGLDGEKDYLKIDDGAWLTTSMTESPAYAVIHRIAVAQDHRRRGAAHHILQTAEKVAMMSGRESVRIDTHPKNIPMQMLLEKGGYTRCGIIYIDHAEESTPERFAYEKLITA